MKKKAVIISLFFIFIGCFINSLGGKYPTKGVATYYTKKSCQREGTSGIWTASGERYDERALTCAMRDKALFGKYINVINTENGKSVVVRVNDFGPNKKLFQEGRIIDLSKQAFHAIADLNKGIIEVKIEIQPFDSKIKKQSRLHYSQETNKL
jgi:rare lipoprotein A